MQLAHGGGLAAHIRLAAHHIRVCCLWPTQQLHLQQDIHHQPLLENQSRSPSDTPHLLRLDIKAGPPASTRLSEPQQDEHPASSKAINHSRTSIINHCLSIKAGHPATPHISLWLDIIAGPPASTSPSEPQQDGHPMTPSILWSYQPQQDTHHQPRLQHHGRSLSNAQHLSGLDIANAANGTQYLSRLATSSTLHAEIL